MLKIEATSVYGIKEAMRGMRNPMNSWAKGDTHVDHGNVIIGPNDLALAKQLRKAGSDHRKYLRQIFVSADITGPLYWWKEFDTYKVGTVANSCSTMHKIASKPIEISDFSIEHLTSDARRVFSSYVDFIELQRISYINEGKSKEDWYTLIQMLPSSYNQMRTVTMNYENLINMYNGRKNHKLDEWRVDFIDWIKTLPYAEELIICEE